MDTPSISCISYFEFFYFVFFFYFSRKTIFPLLFNTSMKHALLSYVIFSRYLTCTEWSTLYGGYKTSSHSGSKAEFRRLPLTHCPVSLMPFNHPYMDPKGNVYDLEAILPFIRKFKVNPVTGEVSSFPI